MSDTCNNHLLIIMERKKTSVTFKLYILHTGKIRAEDNQTCL